MARYRQYQSTPNAETRVSAEPTKSPTLSVPDDPFFRTGPIFEHGMGGLVRAVDADDEHRERFSALVNEAARKRE